MSRRHKNPYTRELMIAYLIDLQSKQEKRLAKSDVPEPERSYCRALFGKWIYALEAAGIVVPTEAALARRKAHKEKWKKKHKAMSYWRSAAGRAERKRLEALKAKSDEDCSEDHGDGESCKVTDGEGRQ